MKVIINDLWLISDIEALLRKNQANVRYKQLKLSESLEEYNGCKIICKEDIGRALRRHGYLW